MKEIRHNAPEQAALTLAEIAERARLNYRPLADGVRLENDMGDYQLVIDNSDGTHIFPVNPHDVLDAVEGYRQHLLEGESVRAERARAGGGSWEEYRESLARTDPEWVDVMLEVVDLERKRLREAS